MNFNIIFLVQIIVTIFFSLMASIYDIKKNIIPNRLNYSLLLFGLISNLILSLISNNIKFILASFISMLLTYCVTYMLWKLNMWGGGDVKLFTAIAAAIPLGINIDFLNIFPKLSVYPFSFSVIVNSILVSFPFLVIFLAHLTFRNKIFNRNIDFLVNIVNLASLKYIFDSALNKTISILDLKEGMIVNDCYFNDEHIVDLINDVDGNLKVYRTKGNDEFKYYFKSQSAGGITDRDMCLLKIMNEKKFIPDNLSIKISFPFTPSILLGLLISVFYGDLMMLFTKNFYLVI
ncbi:MAG: prepilin peptidase [Methanobrevibacter sp.]|uniref:A24 family peptidase n=1 Tax=Methanobrevibacter sp. TaxID=66852 RepID=UPI0025F52AB5|nr:A24 family peptidase [Methanobrevibacter sp.]MBE6508777.1 prepilin peptidase [Methanobrevibacter sp.]